MRRITTLIILVIVLIVVAVITYYLYTNPQITYSYQSNVTKIYLSDKSEREIEQETLINTDKQSKNVNELKVTGWIPDWDLADGYNTLVNQSNRFYSISPFWLIPNDDGSLNEVANSVNPELINFTKNNNIRLIPTIPLFDHDILSNILNNREYFNRHILEILNKIDTYKYDGIDLDYESTKLEDKGLFFEFLETLSRELKSRGKIFSFTVMPKWGDKIYYPSLPQTRLVQDYKRISDLVDEFRIMTYDFSGKTSQQIAPIAPLEWIERVIQYAINSGVERDKIYLGVHTYAYDWSERAKLESIDLINWYGNLIPIKDLEEASAYYFGSVENVIRNYSMSYTYDTIWGEAIGEYMFEGEKRIVVFPTQESINARKDLASEYGIAGIAVWRIGDEGSLKY